MQPLGPNQERWLSALESGEYRQTRGFLEDENGNCCLGVGSRLFGCSSNKIGPCTYFDGDNAYAPERVVKALALRSKKGYPLDGIQSLVVLNDSCNTFAEIAAIVRADPGQYFTEPR